jgi:TnpA family transposase
MKKNIANTEAVSIPQYVKDWIPPESLPYLMQDNEINFARLKFLLYKQLAHHIKTNKLVLEHSVKHREVEDNFIKLPKWKKERKKLLKNIPYPRIRSSPTLLLKEKEENIKALYAKLDYDINNGNNEDIIFKNNDKNWRVRPLDQASDPNETLFANLQKRSIVDVMYFVDHKLNFSQAFDAILPRSKRQIEDEVFNFAAILANAIRMGIPAMAEASDLNLSSLVTAESANIRMETLTEAIHIINSASEKLGAFNRYNICGKRHASLDGLKLATRIQNIAARHSPKFLGMDSGVSAYNAILNHFPIASRLISSNEYEGNFAFELLHQQNTKSFNIERISTDKHGMNCLNFALFDFTGHVFAPRIPKPHKETLWGLGKHKDYEGLIIPPHKIANKHHIINDWDNMQRMLVSLLSGEAMPSVVINKMSSKNYSSKTKLAFTHYNHIVRSEFILLALNSKEFRRAIECALNRGEAYNSLYRAITVLNGGKFRGQSETEMMIWDQCTRLVTTIILYYNTYILDHLYQNAKTDAEKDYICSLSPGAWVHVNLLGYYRFFGLEKSHYIDEWLASWDWQRVIKTG